MTSKKMWRVGVVIAGVLFIAMAGMTPGCGDGSGGTPLLCYVGGTMKPAMEEIAARYEKQTGQKVLIESADSGQLLIRIEQAQQGDLYVSHDPFLAGLMRKGLGDKGWTVAALSLVIVVRKDNTSIRGFRDLAKPGVRLAVSDAQYSTTGWIVSTMAQKAGIEKELEMNMKTRPRSGSEAANMVSLGTVDAAVCWNAVAYLRRDKLKAVDIEPDLLPKKDVDVVTSATYGEIDMGHIRVTIATLKCSKQLGAARAFAEFAASGEGAQVWAKFGFSPADRSRDNAAAPKPPTGSVLVYCSAGMQAPISKLADEFQKETGARVELVYGGANVLLGQIELNRKGDVYIAGDADYIEMAAKKGLVRSQKTICHFVPVLLVSKKSEKNIKSLADALQPGTKIGQGDLASAAVGRLMPRILELNGIDADAWKKNVKLETPTVNELGLQVKLGTIDAAVVWDAIAFTYKADAEIVALDPRKNVCPEVAAAVLTTAANQAGASAFVDFIASKRARDILTECGYTVEKP